MFNWFHSFSQLGKILLLLQYNNMVYKTEVNIYNIGEVENKSWSNTVIDTNRFYGSIYVTRIYHLKWPLSVSIYLFSFKHLEIIQVF